MKKELRLPASRIKSNEVAWLIAQNMRRIEVKDNLATFLRDSVYVNVLYRHTAIFYAVKFFFDIYII